MSLSGAKFSGANENAHIAPVMNPKARAELQFIVLLNDNP
jgi:hypothetical protein